MTLHVPNVLIILPKTAYSVPINYILTQIMNVNHAIQPKDTTLRIIKSVNNAILHAFNAEQIKFMIVYSVIRAWCFFRIKLVEYVILI